MFPGASDHPTHGVSRYIHEISKRLGKKGFVILNVRPSNDAKSSLQVIADSYLLLRVGVTNLQSMESVLRKIDLHLGSIPHYLSYLEAGRRFLASLDRQVILHTHGFGVIIQPKKESKKCKRVATIHGFGQLDTLASGQSSFRATLLHSILKRIYQNAEQYTTFSETMKTIAGRLYGLNPDKVAVVPHGVDAGFFSKAASSAEIKDMEHRLGLDKPYRILFLGHLVSGKGLDVVLKAFKLLKNRRSDIMLTLKVGYREDYPEIVKLIDRLDIRDLVRIVFGHLSEEDLRTLYKTSNAFVNYHFVSGYSTALLEAMASSLPPIVYRHGSNIDIVDKSCGVVLETLEAKELADAIEVVVEDAATAKKLGRNALNRVQKEYDWDQAIVPKYASLYADLNS
jgi:glycosyltransferase involved in cell wall biosynthesis